MRVTMSMFTGDSQFCLRGNDGRTAHGVIEINIFGRLASVRILPLNGRSVKVWGGIRFDGRTELVIVPPPALTAYHYTDEILP